jgi:hypothetical protein
VSEQIGVELIHIGTPGRRQINIGGPRNCRSGILAQRNPIVRGKEPGKTDDRNQSEKQRRKDS